MTAEELKIQLNNVYGITKEWPDHLEVSADTYANVCQHVFDRGQEKDFTDRKDIKRFTLSFGVNNGLMFKGVELILVPPKPALLTFDEMKTLYDLLAPQYISYENDKGIAVVRKLRQIIAEGV